MDFWSAHSIWFLLGFLIWPRMLLLYTAAIPPASIGYVLGFALVPRLVIAAGMTDAFWQTDRFLVGFCWVAAIILDVFGAIAKFGTHLRLMRQWARNMSSGSLRGQSWY